jgi:hypothetical protein
LTHEQERGRGGDLTTFRNVEKGAIALGGFERDKKGRDRISGLDRSKCDDVISRHHGAGDGDSFGRLGPRSTGLRKGDL